MDRRGKAGYQATEDMVTKAKTSAIGRIPPRTVSRQAAKLPHFVERWDCVTENQGDEDEAVVDSLSAQAAPLELSPGPPAVRYPLHEEVPRSLSRGASFQSFLARYGGKGEAGRRSPGALGGLR